MDKKYNPTRNKPEPVTPPLYELENRDHVSLNKCRGTDGK